MTGNGNGNGSVKLSLTTLAVIIGLLVQAAGIVAWATSEHNARVTLMERVRELEVRAAELNKGQDQRLGQIDDTMRRESNQQGIVNTTTNSRIDNINGHLSRLDDRVQRVVEALDSVYKQFVDHIKDHK